MRVRLDEFPMIWQCGSSIFNDQRAGILVLVTTGT